MRIAVFVAALALSTAASAAPPAPTGDEVKKVFDYWKNGAEAGPILLEFSLCADAKKNEEGKLACTEKLGPKIKKGDSIVAFVQFFVPKGAKYEDVKVKFFLGEELRSTSDFTLTESFSYGNYKKTAASKAGTWRVELVRGETLLGSATVTAE